jgi:uncharacterized protein YqjF (DUF2071 family)
MKLRSVVRDCLFLNWALPVEALPEPPAPLRYQRFPWQGRDHAFVSALLFHHDAVRLRALPLLRVGYPQLNVRSYVLDEEGVPSVLFHCELMPAWVAPGIRLVAGHPAASARLDFPRPSQEVGAEEWSWRVERGGALTVRARVHSPEVGEGPRIGTWEDTVRFFQERPRGYAVQDGRLRRVDVWHPPAAGVWPLAAEIAGNDALLRRLLPLAGGPRDESAAQAAPSSRPDPAQLGGAVAADAGSWPQDGRRPSTPAVATATTIVLAPPAAVSAVPGAQAGSSAWPPLHSCWLCPEMPFSIVFDLVPKVHPVVQQLPHPAAGRISSPALSAGSVAGPLDAAPGQGIAAAAARSDSAAEAALPGGAGYAAPAEQRTQRGGQRAERGGPRAAPVPVTAGSRVRATAA